MEMAWVWVPSFIFFHLLSISGSHKLRIAHPNYDRMKIIPYGFPRLRPSQMTMRCRTAASHVFRDVQWQAGRRISLSGKGEAMERMYI